ncbi:cytochrome P450 [Actinomadura graeca]|uniref:Cytochrome P450 n=2 Tax=Actinomadura graeca TaxID=2750812 RepID=A0ABX8R8N9_9ACTN|nr:cytochrome P450 [Actinomadura graeca]
MRLRDDLYCWWILPFEEARAALADPRLSRDPRAAAPAWRTDDRDRGLEDGSALATHLLTLEPPDHTRLRRSVTGAFSAERVERMRDRIQEIAGSLVDGFQDRGSAEIIADYAFPLAISVIGEILGVPAEDHRYFRQWTSNALPDGPPVPRPDVYLKELIAAKRRNPGDDLISELIQEDLGETELLSMVFLLALAGHEGNVALVANAVLALLRHPDQLSLLRSRPELLDPAIEEVLRWDGPMELAAWRFPTEPVTIGGTVIGAGEPVVISLAAAHRDPGRFTAPDEFRIDRADTSHLAFGRGVHYCLGARLARVEGRIAVGTLLDRLPGLALAAPADQIRRQPSFVIRGVHSLPVVFSPGGH